MKLNKDNYLEILREKQISDETVWKGAGLSERTYLWILDKGFIEVETLERIADVIGVHVSRIAREDSLGCDENTIKFVKDAKKATVTFSQGRYCSKIKKLSVSHPEECQILAENKDGSILAHVPVCWVKITPPKEMTEEHKQAILKNLKHNK